MLEFETERNPLAIRRDYADAVLSIADLRVVLTEQLEYRALELSNYGIQPLDALHLACAEEAQADYFCTCDDRFLRRAKAVHILKIKVLFPLELIRELDT